MKLKYISTITATLLSTSISITAYAADTFTFSHESGTYSSTQFVNISPSEGYAVFYTTDGSEPDVNSTTAGKSALLVTANTRIRAASYLDGYLIENDEIIVRIRTAAPAASKDSGTYKNVFRVKLTCPDETAQIFYTTDGSTPTKDSAFYSKFITINKDTVLKFAAFSKGNSRSTVVTRKYTINSDVYSDKNRQGLFDLINKTRKEYGLAPLEELPQLSEIAQQRAKECASYFSHTRPDGTKWHTLLSEAGLKRSARGENIAYYYPTAKQALAAWMDDYGHRSNILAPDAKYVGIGCYEKNGCTYWAQLYISE